MSLLRHPRVTSLAASLALAASAGAQVVTPKTVPVFNDEQFSINPASRPALSLAIAFDDTLADPFSNPAKASRLRGVIVTVAPYAHSISDNGGGGQTLPASLFGSVGRWSGGILAATQQLQRGGWQWNLPTSERTVSNQYVTAVIARRLHEGLGVGASVSHADLRGIDGVDLLYAGSDRIEQSGHTDDYRLGATKEWMPGQVLELVAVRSRTSMRHDVHFTINTWDAAGRVMNTTQRQDLNLDQTDIWGLHTQYAMPVGTEGWRIGALATANRLSHPKIPNYVLQNVPRDPGNTNAYNVGIGAVRTTPTLTFGLNVIMEPMSSDTWADAATPTTRTDGTVIPAGARTIENHFVFHNRKASLGLGHTWAGANPGEGLTADIGLTMHRIDYQLTQVNNIVRTTRQQHESWLESGPSFGLRYRSRDVEVSYAYRATCGTRGCDFPGIGGRSDDIIVNAPSAGGTIIAAPSSALFLQSGTETSHHLAISLPIR